MDKQSIQYVSLHLSDGRVLRYSGPAQVAEDELEIRQVIIKAVTISAPKPLPTGMQFEDLSGGKDGDG